jgi:hypothetical protein
MGEGREPDQGEPARDRQGLYTEAEVEEENPQGSPSGGAENLLRGLERVRGAARRNSPGRFTALLHHVTVDLLREAYHKLNPHPVRTGLGPERGPAGLRGLCSPGFYRFL